MDTASDTIKGVHGAYGAYVVGRTGRLALLIDSPGWIRLIATHAIEKGDSARELDGGAPISLASDVSCHFLGDEAILFSERAQRLYRLNTSAALVWCCCEEAMAPAAIARLLAQKFDIPADRALEDVFATFAEWKALSLVASESQ